MRDRTKLIQDKADRYKLHVTLPGGRYQLSLDDGAVNVLRDGLGLHVGSVVPEPFVRVFVATRDAWFPRQRNVDSVIEDLPADGKLTASEREQLVQYLTTTSIAKRDESRVKQVVRESPVSDEVGPDDLRVRSLPLAPTGQSKTSPIRDPTTDNGGDEPSTQQTASAPSDSGSAEESTTPATPVEQTDVTEIPGIAEVRGNALVEAGFISVAKIAESRPADIAEAANLDDQLATVAVEGARELVGYEQPTASRLAKQTGVAESTFDPALASLAASGVPPSEAAPVLRILFGPSIADINGVSGQQAYFLWEAGYRSPHEIAEATVEELITVRQLGPKTAPKIKQGASSLLAE